MSIQRIGVLGGGAWGAALAQTCARAGRAVTLWEFDAGNADYLANRRESRFLPGVKLEDTIKVTRALGEAAQNDAILLVVPAQAMRPVVKALAQTMPPGTPLIACAKGIEDSTQKFMTEIIAECAPGAVPAILSGPSFAADVARGLPTAVTIAASDADAAEALAHALNSGSFRADHARLCRIDALR
jgi:glycerol-3-phosphate dehydrogenase (NAD(P)+)